MIDSTRVIFHFYPPGETGVREIDSDPLLINYSFMLQPEQVTSVTAQYPASGGSPIDISLYSIFPHMHLLGKEIGAYAVRPGQDTLPLINIPHWNFDWQDFYKFRYLQKLPQGSTVHGYGTFDNTSSNIHNPNSPPITVFFGLNTTDEMFITYFQYLPYVAGDENHDLTELTLVGLEETLSKINENIQIFPNPFNQEGVRILMNHEVSSQDQIIIYDGQGNRIIQLKDFQGNEVYWDGKSLNGQDVKTGIYFVSINSNGIFMHKKLIKTR